MSAFRMLSIGDCSACSASPALPFRSQALKWYQQVEGLVFAFPSKVTTPFSTQICAWQR